MSNRREAKRGYFSSYFDTSRIETLRAQSLDASEDEVAKVIQSGECLNLEDFARLISPAATQYLELMASQSRAITAQYFGKVMRLFAPIYLSNECVNICKYCGFSKHNDIPRITIPIDQAEREIRKLAQQGFRTLLIVAGEHPKYVNNGYVSEVIQKARQYTPGISIELGPMETKDYRPIVDAGCEGLIAYQETYHPTTYTDLHTAGPKQFYHWRLDTIERGYDAGFRKLGIGALFGLYDWRYEALSIATHAQYLLKRCWKASLSISLPRMRPASGAFEVDSKHVINDRELVQTICALRWLLPQVGITLSTREPASLRDGLVSIGVTQMSAGSCTEPGGYTEYDADSWKTEREQEGQQFEIADERSPAAIALMLQSKGYEPVWKDFDNSLNSIAQVELQHSS